MSGVIDSDAPRQLRKFSDEYGDNINLGVVEKWSVLIIFVQHRATFCAGGHTPVNILLIHPRTSYAVPLKLFLFTLESRHKVQAVTVTLLHVLPLVCCAIRPTHH